MTFKTLLTNINEIYNTLQIKGLSSTNLKMIRQFYLAYPQISQTLSDKSIMDGANLLKCFSFSHFIELIKIDDDTKKLFYEVETIKGNWSVRELKRQIETLLYERISLSVADVGQMNFYVINKAKK